MRVSPRSGMTSSSRTSSTSRSSAVRPSEPSAPRALAPPSRTRSPAAPRPIPSPGPTPVPKPAAPRSPPRPSAGPSPSLRPGYYVQIWAVKTDSAAAAEIVRAKQVGFDVVIARESGLLKLRAGAFPNRGQAEAAAGRIKARLGRRPFVVDEAGAGARARGCTLPSRADGVPLAGVPVRAAAYYLRQLIAQGHRVAICEQ